MKAWNSGYNILLWNSISKQIYHPWLPFFLYYYYPSSSYVSSTSKTWFTAAAPKRLPASILASLHFILQTTARMIFLEHPSGNTPAFTPPEVFRCNLYPTFFPWSSKPFVIWSDPSPGPSHYTPATVTFPSSETANFVPSLLSWYLLTLLPGMLFLQIFAWLSS